MIRQRFFLTFYVCLLIEMSHAIFSISDVRCGEAKNDEPVITKSDDSFGMWLEQALTDNLGQAWICYKKENDKRTISFDGRQMAGVEKLLEAIRERANDERNAGRDLKMTIISNIDATDDEITNLSKAVLGAGSKTCTPISSTLGVCIKARIWGETKGYGVQTSFVEWSFSNFTLNPIEIPSDGYLKYFVKLRLEGDDGSVLARGVEIGRRPFGVEVQTILPGQTIRCLVNPFMAGKLDAPLPSKSYKVSFEYNAGYAINVREKLIPLLNAAKVTPIELTVKDITTSAREKLNKLNENIKALDEKSQQEIEALRKLSIEELAKRRQGEQKPTERFVIVGLILTKVKAGTSQSEVRALIGQPELQKSECDYYTWSGRNEIPTDGTDYLEVIYKGEKYLRTESHSDSVKY